MTTHPNPNPQRCPMLVEAGDLDDVAPRLEGEHKHDVCIVGGGYLGLWTAIMLKEREPALRLAIVEADICGGGASGRNSGMALAIWTKFPVLAEEAGTEEALRLCRASADAIGEIDGFARAYALDIEFARTGWLWGATCPRQAGRWAPLLEELARAGVAPFEALDREAVAEKVRADGYLSGVFDAAAATLHPAKLARGLRKVALQLGVEIFEKSEMTRLDRTRPARVETAHGAVTADKVVLAINAWSLRLPELRSGILVITSDDAVTAPMPEFLDAHGWRDGPIVTDSGIFVSGYRPTRDGRIVAGVTGGAIGSGSLAGERFEGRTPRAGDIARALAVAFPDAPPFRFASSWRGPIDRTRTGLPLFGRLGSAGNILFGYGFSGNGIVGCRLGAKVLTALALRRSDEWSACALVRQPARWLPPEPARTLGAHLVRWAVRRQDRFDREGRDQGFLGRSLAALAPGGIVTTPAD